ncbi:hypothetical protein PR003_g19303 [Phytophthora rubi]|uniref:Reverse transcriptase domain-containing protein n=2 Tax=Phytophthora rubi TaxID=129364 RepID=A0A6A4E962_9STRA|nr:hypothetical protein PR003_g19303 [Phytophthora rubi]
MQRSRRHAVSENLLIDKEVDDMLSNQVIEPGEGAWGFPVVIVRKKDGSVRFCIDYRSLNAVTVKDVYPLPRVDETLEALHGSQRFTSLDLHSGYWPGKENHLVDALSREPVPATIKKADARDRPADDSVIGLQDVQSPAEEKVATVNVQHEAKPTHGLKSKVQTEDIEADVDGAATSAVQAAAIRRVEAAELGVVQFTDDDIKREQGVSVHCCVKVHTAVSECTVLMMD